MYPPQTSLNDDHLKSCDSLLSSHTSNSLDDTLSSNWTFPQLS